MNDLFNSLIAGTAVAQAPVPAAPPINVKLVDLQLPLLDYQLEAVTHALRDASMHPYGYIALDMGLGKTPCALAVAASLSAAGIKPTLIVVPPSLRVNWQRECRKFAPWLKVATVVGARPMPGDHVPAKADVLLIGDSSLAGWADFLTGKVQGLVVDEAHRFKNKSKRSEALAQLATGLKRTPSPIKGGRATITTLASGDDLPKMRVLMSGTPTPNGRHAELATQIDVLGDKAWRDIGGKGTFFHYYTPQVNEYGERVNAHGDELFDAMSNSWYFRRLRDAVLDLPNKGRSPIAIEGRGKAVKEYKLAEEDLIAWLAGKQDGKVSDGQVRAQAIIKLNTLRRMAGEAKVQATVEHVKELLDEQPGGVFIVAEHRLVIDNLLLGLSKYNPTVVAGGMSDADKADNIDRFCSGESRVMVGQITAAGVGLTLHGGGINHHVVIMQLPWTPAELKQAEDRLHRIGQTHDVMVEVALCAIDGTLTIDERLWGTLESKNFNSTQLTDGEGSFLLAEVQGSILDSYR